MRWEGVAREVWANLRGGAARFLMLTLIAAALAGALAAADILTTRALIADARHYRDSGAAILTISAPGRIDAARCRALARVSGVGAAGALRARPTPLTAAALPAAPLTAYETTPGFGALLGARGSGVLVSDEVVETLGVVPGDPFATTEGLVEIGGRFAYPDDGRRSGYGWAVMMETADTRPFDECWVLVWPQSDLVRSLLPGVATAGREAPELGQLNTLGGAHLDTVGLLERRVTAWAPTAGCAVAGALGFVVVRARRLALAADLHAGARRRDVALIAVLEGVVWMSSAAALGLGVCGLLVAPELASDRGALLAMGARVVGAVAAAGAVGVGAGALGVRERHLLRYFRDR